MKALTALKDGELEIKTQWLSKKRWAELDFEKGRVVINFPLFLVSCFIHELTHWEHPDWSESRVVRSEQRQIKQMSVRTIKCLARRLIHELSKKEG